MPCPLGCTQGAAQSKPTNLAFGSLRILMSSTPNSSCSALWSDDSCGQRGAARRVLGQALPPYRHLPGRAALAVHCAADAAGHRCGAAVLCTMPYRRDAWAAELVAAAAAVALEAPEQPDVPGASTCACTPLFACPSPQACCGASTQSAPTAACTPKPLQLGWPARRPPTRRGETRRAGGGAGKGDLHWGWV